MAKDKKSVSMSVIKRLPRYYRFLGELKKNGITRISSKELSQRMGFTASQIRQDLNCFGGFGQQGYGYNVELLQQEIGGILGFNRPKSTVLIGVGDLGRALARSISFESNGFRLIGLFDSKESLVGQMVRNQPIRSIASLDEFCRENLPEVAILCLPKAAAKSISEQLIKLGVKGFWNFSGYEIPTDNPALTVENVHFTDSLMTLSFRLNNKF